MSDYRPIPPVENNDATDAEPKKKNIFVIVAVVLVLQLVVAFFIGRWVFKSGYENSKTNTATNIRQGAYNTVYNMTEEEYHLSNRVAISLDGIREKADLEVLSIDTCYLYKSDKEDKERNLILWYKIPGTGTYTVDMRMMEFIADNVRHHVLVKVPEPTITQFKENYGGIKELEYKNTSFFPSNGSIAEGEEIGRKMLAKAHTQMMKEFEMTQAYHQAAQESATKLITLMIKALNPEIPDLTVEIQFVNGSEL